MKFLLVTIFALTYSATAVLGGDEDLIDLMIGVLPEKYNEIDKSDHVGYSKTAIKDLATSICVEGKTVDAEAVAKEFVKRVKEAEADKSTICGTIKKHFAKVMEPMVKAFDDCIDPEFKGAPKTFVKTVVSVLDHTCKMNGEHIIELGNPCLMGINIEKCINEIDSIVNAVKSKDMAKLAKSFNEEACTMYQKGRSCLENQIKSKCKLTITRESAMGLMDAAFKTPCAA